MKKITLLLLTINICIITYSSTATFTGIVVDSENSRPICNAKTCAFFDNYAKTLGGGSYTYQNHQVSNTDGCSYFSGDTNNGKVSWRVLDCVGYYPAEGTSPQFTETSILSLYKWEPRNLVVSARVDRIKKPIPLFIKHIRGFSDKKKREKYNPLFLWDSDFESIVTTNQCVRTFDFLIGDWVKPYGKGENPDMLVTCQKEILGHKIIETPYGNEDREFSILTAKILFSGTGNGICEVSPRLDSVLWIREATTNGYSSVPLVRRKGYTAPHTHFDEFDNRKCYCFRIRTEYDKDGNIVTAYYGKVYGDFRVNDDRGIAFTYYINLTPNDRNLEFDRKTNLNPNDKRRPYEIAP